MKVWKHYLIQQTRDRSSRAPADYTRLMEQIKAQEIQIKKNTEENKELRWGESLEQGIIR